MIENFLSQFWPYIAAIVAAALAYTHRLGKSSGRKEAENEAIRREKEAKDDMGAIQREIQYFDDDSAIGEFDRLHEKRRR